MADLFPREARLKIVDRTIDLIGGTVGFILVDQDYVPNEAHTFLDNAGAGDPVDEEITAAGYTRKTLSGKSLTNDGTRVKFTSTTPITWTGMAAGQTVGAAIMYYDGANDGARRVIAVYDPSNLVLNGSDVQLPMPTNGWLNF